MRELREAAHVALTALNNVLDTYGEPLDKLRISGGTFEALVCREAITALRAALAHGEPSPGWCKHCRQYTIEEPLQAAPTVGEPVAWIYKPNRELLWPSEVEATNPIEVDEYLPLYSHPPRTALTDEQIDDCLPLGMAPYSTLVGPDEIRRFARAIEAAITGGPRNE